MAEDSGFVLERDELWTYPGYHGVARRRLRVWRAAPGSVVAVLTERQDDPGTSITNAAQAILLELERAYPDDVLGVIEHYPDNPEGNRYSTVALDGALHPRWRHLPADEARAMLPGLEEPATT
jgi:hypothetical protein